MKVYIFKNYYDDLAYGEELIKVFANKADAEKALKEAVEETFKTSWDEIRKSEIVDDNTIFEPDYVSTYYRQGYIFFIVEEHEIIGMPF